jgi:hypothetical protein
MVWGAQEGEDVGSGLPAFLVTDEGEVEICVADKARTSCQIGAVDEIHPLAGESAVDGTAVRFKIHDQIPIFKLRLAGEIGI